MNILRTLIVDDEPLGRERIRSLLAQEPDVEVVAECADGPAAVTSIRQHSPDLVFLDVQMPGMDGFEVLRSLQKETLPLVVFVTAYDRHALQAFEVHALDYLLKPFKQARFRETVEHARQTLATRLAGDASKKLLALLGSAGPPSERLSRIPVKTGERVLFVNIDEVDYIESAGNYVVIHTAKENHVVRETLTALEEKLDPRGFIRVSRSALVNAGRIKELQPLFKGDYVVVLQNGKQVPMTRGLREVQDLLKFA
jgi:two-component system LytT family response regulator